MEIEELIKIAESDSWTVTEEEYTNWKGLLFSKYSPAGQDFSISIGPFESAEELINSIHQRYVEYDADSEAYLWLDNEGHGKNGAPYHMRDVLEDMEACKKMIYDLFVIETLMKRSELFMACANEYSYRCNSDCDNCQLYLRYLKEKED